MLTVSRGLMAELARRVLEREARVRFVVRGRSMQPAIEDGDRVTVAPLGRDPRPGEVVALCAAEGLLVHRIVERRRDGTVITAGDNVDHRDSPRPAGDVLGIVEHIERDGRGWTVARDRGALLRAEARRVVAALRRRLLGAAPSGSGA